MSVIFSVDKSPSIDKTQSIDKNKVKQSFSLAANTYDESATLQRNIGLELLNRLTFHNLDHLVVDIGCGTGFFTKELVLRSSLQQMIAVDIAMPMLYMTKERLKQIHSMNYLCADAENLPLLKDSVNRIYSNLALQWCQNLVSVFNNFKQVLKTEGQIFFSTFGPSTLQELKHSWAEVDDFTHVNEFYSVDELFVFLQQSGFNNIQIETKCYQSNYQTVLELMRELKGIGAHNVLSGRNKNTTSKTRMLQMVESYEKHRENGLIPATYEVIFVSATG